MNIIVNSDYQKEILFNCKKIELKEHEEVIIFYNNEQKILCLLSKIRGYPKNNCDKQSFNKIIFDEIEVYVTTNKEHLIWSEFEDKIYTSYMRLKEK